MDPLILSALIGGGSSLLSSLFSGGEKAKERKYTEQQGQKLLAATKPSQPYYQSNFLPAMSDTMQRLVMGNLGQRLSSDMLTKWGINLDDLRKVMGLNVPFSQTQTAQKFYPQFNSPLAQRAMGKYSPGY